MNMGGSAYLKSVSSNDMLKMGDNMNSNTSFEENIVNIHTNGSDE